MKLVRDRTIDNLLKSAATKARRGISGSTGHKIVRILYEEVDKQFNRGSGENLNGPIPWKSAHPFGACVPGPRPLQRSGKLRNAWTGRDSTALPPQISPNSVTIGVRGTLLPRAAVFQSNSPTTIRANPSHRTRSGMLAMRAALGLGPCKIWIREGRLLLGFKIDPRQVGVTRKAADRASQVIFRDLGFTPRVSQAA